MTPWAAVIVALIAATAALAGYMLNGHLGRLGEKRQAYAQALTCAERYAQLPYTFARRIDSSVKTRKTLAKLLVDTQVELAFHRKWLDLDDRAVGAAYSALVDKLAEKNHEYRREALSRRPLDNDLDVEVRDRHVWDCSADAEWTACRDAMRHEVAIPPPALRRVLPIRRRSHA